MLKIKRVLYMQIYRKWRAVKLLCLGSSTAMQACAMVGLEEEGKERKKERKKRIIQLESVYRSKVGERGACMDMVIGLEVGLYVRP